MQSEVTVQDAPLWELLGVFLKIGATGFGGWMSVLGILQVEVVQKRRWVTPKVFSDGLTLGQVLPGPIAIDTVAYLGYRLHGWPGAILSVIAFILPSFLMVLIMTLAYLQYGALPQVAGALKGIGAAVVALILVAAYRMGRNAVRDVWSALLLAATAVAVVVFSVNIVIVIVIAGLAGFLLYRNAPMPSGAGPGRPGAGPAGQDKSQTSDGGGGSVLPMGKVK